MESDSSPQFRSIKTRISEKSLRLPEEIIEEILSRLPVKSLLKFRCVSKPWRALIGSKRFIKKHLANSTKNPNFAHHNIIAKSVQPQLGLKQCYLISVLNDPLTAQFTSCYSMNIRWDSICIVDCCNGIVCLLLDRKHFMLWNPSTRKTKQLPPFDHNTRHERSITIHGFGYDDSSGDYMVLGMIIFPSDGVFGGRCKVYSLRTNSWKIVGDDNLSPFSNKGKFASGKIHWPCGYISYFDLRSEVFDVIFPPIINGVCCRSMGVFGGRLGLLYDDGRGKFDIWVVKEYGVNASWEKVAILPYLHTTMDPGTSYLSLLGIGPNGEILLTGESSFEIFYPEGNGFRHCHGKDLGKFHEAVVYVESLVSL